MTRRVSVLVDADISPFSRSLATASAQATAFSQQLRMIPNRIDVTINVDQSRIGAIGAIGSSAHTASGRTRMLVEALGAVAPAVAPIGATAVPVISGLASAMGFAAVAGVGLVTAFQGVGDALKYVRQAELDPTTEHIEKAQLALQAIGEDAALFVFKMRDMSDEFARVRDQAAKGLFPGLIDSLDEMQSALPRVQDLFFVIGDTLGDIARDSTESLTSDRWAGLIEFLKGNVRPELERLARIGGDLAHGMAEMWIAFQPVNDDFLGSMERMADTFDRWAGSLTASEDFAEFVAYVREAGPDVRESLVAIAKAMLDIAQATAPIGGVVLDALQALAEAISAISNSDIGTPLLGLAVAFAAVNRSVALGRAAHAGYLSSLASMQTQTAATSTRVRTLQADLAALRATSLAAMRAAPPAGFIGPLTQAQAAAVAGRQAMDRMRASMINLGKASALMGGLALATNEAAQDFAFLNTASLALMGTLAGPWGAAVGGGIGLMIDLRKGAKESAEAIDHWTTSMDLAGGSLAAQQAALARSQEEFRKMAAEAETSTRSQVASFLSFMGPDPGFTNADERTREIEELDAAYADLEVTVYRADQALGGNARSIEELDASMTRLQPAMNALGYSWEDLASMDQASFDSTVKALGLWLEYADSAPGKTDRFVEAVGLLGSETEDAATSAERLKDALDAILDPKLNFSEARDEWHQSLQDLSDDLHSVVNPAIEAKEALIDALQGDLEDAATDGARDRIEDRIRKAREELEALREAGDIAGERGLFTTGKDGLLTEGAIQNRDAIRERIRQIEEQVTLAAENGATPRRVAQIFKEGVEQLEDFATGAGISRDELVKFQRQQGLTPELIQTTIEQVGLDEAKAKTEGYREALERINGKHVTSYVDIVAQFLRPKNTGFGATGEHGGFAEGGWTGPGSKYQPAGVVHAEEFVVKRGPAAAYRPWLERLNRLPGYANGGFVQAAAAMPAAPAGIDMRGFAAEVAAHLTPAMLNVRPLYGDVHMQPHNYDAFKRQMEDDRRAASVGGRPL